MLKILKKLFYGFLIGISNMIPGFSGGTMILILGIYEEFSSALANITKTPLKSIKELWAIGVGMVVGIAVAMFTLVICLEKWPIITSSLFVGLVLASFPIIYQNIKGHKITLGSFVTYGLSLGIAIALAFSDKLGFIIDLENPTIFIIFYVVVVSGFAAATMIIPAASGMMVFYAFGLYTPLITLGTAALKALFSVDWGTFGSSLIILIPFGIGVILGIILIAKLMNYLFKHHAVKVWSAIAGLLTSSLFVIYYSAYHNHLENNPGLFTDHIALNIILSIVMLCIGFFGLTFIMKKIQSKKDQK